MRTKLGVSDTVFALCSGALPSAVAVVRLSGARAISIASRLFRPRGGGELRAERGMYFGELVDGNGERFDEGLVLVFRAPHSFTGEDCVEFQCHGSTAVVAHLEASLAALGARPAERGEFSYRAFTNGKLSPEALESLGDLFRARDAAALAAIHGRRPDAIEGLAGNLRQQLIRLAAILDTAVDFVDEYSEVTQAAHEPLELASRECSLAIQRYHHLLGRDLPRAVLVGRSNAGKSSLYNALLGRNRSLVHAEPGTTRDLVEEEIRLGTRSWRLADSAGFREIAGEVERDGIELGLRYGDAAEMILLVVDGTRGLGAEERGILERFAGRPLLVAWNKADCPEWEPWLSGRLPTEPVRVSAVSGEGLESLWQAMERIGERTHEDGGPLPSTTQFSRLTRVAELLEEVRAGLAAGEPPEYASERVRQAMGVLETFVGDVDVEDILDRVFSEFCIGK